MAGTFVKVTMHFQDNKYGWTERHYGKDSIDATYGRLHELAQARSNLLGTGARLTKIIVTDDELPGSSRMFPWEESGVFQPRPTIAGPTPGKLADFPWSGVKIRSQSQPPDEGKTGLYKKTSILSGLPDEYTTTPPDAFKWNAAILPYWTAYQDVLTNGDWGFKCWDVTTSAVASIKVVGYSVLEGVATIHTQLHPYVMPVAGAPPLKVLIAGLKAIPSPAIGGTFVVRSIPDAFTLTVNYGGLTPTTIQKTGVVRLRKRRVVPYTTLTAIGEMRHKRGAGPDKPVGRARAGK